MMRSVIRKTDFGTLILHWALVILLVLSALTGLRIANGSPGDILIGIVALDLSHPDIHVPPASFI